MNKYLIKFILGLLIFCFNYNLWHANINFTVSPIKYEIEASTWSIIKRTATLLNRTDSTLTIYTWKANFKSVNSNWEIEFLKKKDYTWQELSSRINIKTDSFEILPKEKKEINFDLIIPSNATPWWHYWAIFFKNKNSWNSWEWQIKINVEYWVVLLVNIEWEIIKKWDVWNTNIEIIKPNNEVINIDWWWRWGWHSNVKKDNCPYWDLTSSTYDKKCIDDVNNIIRSIKNDNSLLDQNKKLSKTNDNENNNNENNFNINFKVPFINKWNTHIKPKGKIKLIDEDWNEIKWIWKEIIVNNDWAKIWEKIVDYLPLNDSGWVVLPNSNKDFNSEWKWFPYKTYDESWNQILKYWTPDEYYTNKNLKKNLLLMPWERLNENICKKNIKAITEISYLNEDWEEVKFNSAKNFYVKYKEINVWLNPYAIWIFWIILFFFFIIFLIFKKKKTKCRKCSKKINKDMKICPYCWKKQKKIK